MKERLKKIASHLHYRGDNGYGSHAWDFIVESPYLAGLGCENLLVFTKSKNVANAAAHTLRVVRNEARRQAKPEYRKTVDRDVLAAFDELKS